MTNYIALAIPVFFAAIGVEILAGRWKKRSTYRFTDAISDLSAGITQQTLLVFQKGALLGAYVWTYEHHRVFSLAPSSVGTWLLAMILVDFIYYWWHRLSHEVNILWAAHVVHHSSEDYNLAVALRQGVFTPWTSLPLHLVLAVVGIPPLVLAAADSFNTLYQFWIHTELVGKLGWLEGIFNTPSHHRVHHGINPRYLDKNYGGILILVDWLFGTLEVEGEPVVYGLVKPLRSFNPLWVQVHRWYELAEITARSKHPVDRLRIWLSNPRWLPRDLGPNPAPAEVTPATFEKYDPKEPPGLRRYIRVQLAIVAVAITTLMLKEDSVSWPVAATVAGLILVTVTTWGGLAESRPWALRLELARLASIAALLTLFLGARLPPTLAGAGALGMVAIAGSMAWWVARSRTEPLGGSQTAP